MCEVAAPHFVLSPMELYFSILWKLVHTHFYLFWQKMTAQLSDHLFCNCILVLGFKMYSHATIING